MNRRSPPKALGSLLSYHPLRNFTGGSSRNTIAVHGTAFPATLYHYRPAANAHVFDKEADHDRLDESLEYGMLLQNGMVSPLVHEYTHSNGLVFMPNTTFMQEFTRLAYENHIQAAPNKENMPTIVQITKGTKIPSGLQLLHERDCRFTLQPSVPLSLADFGARLNSLLDERGLQESVEAWLETHDWADAHDDDDVSGWMRE